MANGERYRIGELSKRTGLSAAALHHYEEMGLIAPERDPESGYRLYGAEELFRLQEIAVLKEMGFKLSDIARMKPPNGEDAGERSRAQIWKDALRRQAQLIDARRRELDKMKKLIESGLFSIEVRGEIVLEELTDFIRQVGAYGAEQRGEARRRFFSEEERKRLPEFAETGEEAEVWASLLRRAHAGVGSAADAPDSLKLAEDLLDYALGRFGGDAKLVERYWSFVRPDESESAKVYGLDAETTAYIEAITDEYLRRSAEKMPPPER
ncbi:MerR family transcriptional regulator [Saccharibacillus sp. O23]|uniref:MerR family transcriptional regulator n=1 Tax=Saccharibacillus sp. O23 TaxID=2009338 RepID=UPI0015C65599|nr:MerR family transcriptional regulator [Saccharibacillus sp. O23]